MHFHISDLAGMFQLYLYVCTMDIAFTTIYTRSYRQVYY